MKNIIKQKRLELDLTQDELAEILGVSRQTIISLEKQKYNPSITLAFKISKAFNTSIEKVFLFEEE